MAVSVEKVMRMSEVDIIRYQLLTHCFVNSLKLSESELACLLLLVRNGECDLSDFSQAASSISDTSLKYSEVVFKTPQTVRNFLTRAEKDKLIIKTGTSRKKIQINPDLQIQSGGTIVLNFKMIYLAS